VADALIELVTRDRSALVFVSAEGDAIRHSNFRNRVWAKATAAAGLQGLRLHDLRHTHAAWLISAGVPVLAISRRLGHASITVTMDRYGHLLPEVDASIMTALDDTLDKIDRGSTVGATDCAQQGATEPSSAVQAGQPADGPSDQGP